MKTKLFIFLLILTALALLLTGCDESTSGIDTSADSGDVTTLPDSGSTPGGETSKNPEETEIPGSTDSTGDTESPDVTESTKLPENTETPGVTVPDTTAPENTGCAHNYESVIHDPTCTEQGYTEHTCTRCKDSYRDEIKDKIPHTYEASIAKYATCTVDGIRKYACVCGDFYTEVIKAEGHEYKETVREDATCTMPGYVKYDCDNCISSYTEALDPKGHGYTETVISESSCDKDGLAKYVCSCGDNYEKILPASHKVVNGQCTLCLRTVWDKSVDTSWYDASKNEFTITSAAQLAGLAELVNGKNSFAGKTVKLGESLDLGNNVWTPIGSSAAPFEGIFDGCGKTLSHFRIEGELSDAGIFGHNSGEIKNLNVSNATLEIESSESNLNVGIIAGTNGGSISACTVSGRINVHVTAFAGAGNIYLNVGGVAGQNNMFGQLTGCGFDGAIELGHTAGALNIGVGGIIGKNFSAYNVENCTASVQIKHEGYVSHSVIGYVWAGGIVGHHSTGALINCSASGSIESAFNATKSNDCELYGGGLVGYMSSGKAQGCSSSVALTLTSTATSAPNGVYGGGFAGYIKGTVIGCFASGNVSASALSTGGMYMGNCVIGGFVGKNFGGSISQSYATGAVSILDGNDVTGGGFVGYNMEKGNIENCYSRGKVTVKALDYITYNGGFAGVNHYSTIKYCYAAGSVEVTCEKSRAMGGGIAGQNFSGSILYSYALGNVTVTGVKSTGGRNTSTAGTIVAEDYYGDYTGCYYTDGQSLKSSSNSTAKYGTAKSYMTLVGSNFGTKTLGWSTDIWNFSMSPSLKIFDN